ncbi:hypothetical protein JP74_15640 [Devosia sp. 17-2-E-8]|nr:hypothetical protein JP74_15640 [Devosia sp. 17-2-E-8]
MRLLRPLRCSDQPFADHLFTHVLAGAPHGLSLLPCSRFGRFLVIFPTLHFPEHAFSLEALLQNTEGLIDVVVAYQNLQKLS